jgi:hypothetical protein
MKYCSESRCEIEGFDRFPQLTANKGDRNLILGQKDYPNFTTTDPVKFRQISALAVKYFRQKFNIAKRPPAPSSLPTRPPRN